MVGRGILYHPTLPLEIKGVQVDDTLKLNKRFILRLVEEIGRRLPTEQSRLRKTKEYWCLLWKELPISECEARTVLHEQDYEAVEKKILAFTQ